MDRARSRRNAWDSFLANYEIRKRLKSSTDGNLFKTVAVMFRRYISYVKPAII